MASAASSTTFAGGNAAPSIDRVEATSAAAQAKAACSARPAAGKIELDKHGLPQPAGGRKEYTGPDGQVSRVVEWFGYKLHLLVDTRHEVSLAYRISSTKAGDNELLPSLVDQSQANLPRGRMKTLANDKAADDIKVRQKLRTAGIQPVIQNRSLWRDEQERLLPGHDRNSNIVYDESGTLHCYDRASAPIVRHRMSFIGHEPSRGILKYRCLAMHEGWLCPMSSRCNAGKKYGLTVRVKQDIDLRRLPDILRATNSSSGSTRGVRRWSGATRGSRYSGASTTGT